MAFTIVRPIIIKAVVTNQLKEEMALKTHQSLQQIEKQLTQLEQQATMWQQKVKTKQDPQVLKIQQKINEERQKLLENKQSLRTRLKQIAELTLEQEVVQGKVDGLTSIAVGDAWQDIAQAEIVIKDGIVMALRGPQEE